MQHLALTAESQKGMNGLLNLVIHVICQRSISLCFLETTLSSGSSTTFTRSPPLSRRKIDLTPFYGPAFTDKEQEIMFNYNHMYDYYITQSTFVCSWTASLIDYFNDMNVMCCSF